MEKFATAISCVDGRVQAPVTEYLRKTAAVDFVDTITAPGASRLLAEGIHLMYTELIKKGAEISVNAHGSRLIAIAGHHQCSQNSKDKDEQLKQILAAVRIVDSWSLNARVIGLWVDEHRKVVEVKVEHPIPTTASHGFLPETLIDQWITRREG